MNPGATADVVVDTNMLLMVFEQRVDIISELERLLGRVRLIVPEVVMAEIESLAKSNPRARAALAYLSRSGRFEVVPSPAGLCCDDAVIHVGSHAERGRRYVLTNDREMRQRLRSIPVPVIYLRGRNRLVLEGGVPP